jgi:hypothetical protein
MPLGHLIIVQGQADLPQVIFAGYTIGRLSHFLNCGEQEANQQGDDRDHDQQFDQGEGEPSA